MKEAKNFLELLIKSKNYQHFVLVVIKLDLTYVLSFVFLGNTHWHMEAPRLGVQSEL